MNSIALSLISSACVILVLQSVFHKFPWPDVQPPGGISIIFPEEAWESDVAL